MAHYRKDCISFFMTTKCNLSCSYCYLKNYIKNEESINLNFAFQGTKDYFSKSKSRHIRYYAAGEPTLAFEKMRKILDFAKQIAGKEIKVEIQTNGVFSNKIASWIASNANIIWISCDGPPSIQNKLRPKKKKGKTSKIIEKNINILLNEGIEKMVGIRSTITPINLYRQIEMIEYFNSLKVSAIFSDPVFPSVSNVSTKKNEIELEPNFMIEYAHNFIKAYKKANELGIFYGSILSVNFDEKTEYFCRSCLPSPHLTTDGYISCCDMAFFGYIFPVLIYGKYNSTIGKIEYDLNKIKAIRSRKASQLRECQGCEVLYNCAGACLGEGVNETGRLLGVKKDYCEAIRFLAQNMPLNQGLYPYHHP